MKKIPTVFEREYKDHKVVGITDKFTSEKAKQAFLYGNATVKYDGSCCAIIGGKFYKRFDAKIGRKIPKGAIPCCEPDLITGHHPHWVPVNYDNPSNKWFSAALLNYLDEVEIKIVDLSYYPGIVTFEAVGPHFQGNPYGLDRDTLLMHGVNKVDSVERTFEGVKKWLEGRCEEGLVFWFGGEPVCKIKRSDFGFEWPCK